MSEPPDNKTSANGHVGGSLARRLPGLLGALALLAMLVAAWQIAANGASGSDPLPPPSRVLSSGWADRGSLWENLLPTLRATTLGFALSLVVGFLLSIAIDWSATARRVLVPLLVGSQTLPLIVLAPLVVIWFGFDLTPKVLLVALVTFFPITVGLIEGYASADPDATRLLRSMGAGRWQAFMKLRLPGAMPRFFTGLRVSITYAVVAAVFAEYAGAEKGLGIYMQTAKNSFRTDLVLAAVLVTTALTLVLYALTFVVERFALPWHHLQRKAERP